MKALFPRPKLKEEAQNLSSAINDREEMDGMKLQLRFRRWPANFVEEMLKGFGESGWSGNVRKAERELEEKRKKWQN